VRPFTISRLADVVHLARISHGITVESVEEAMMVTRDRANELVKQAEEMRLLRVDGNTFFSSNVGNSFFEAFQNGDNSKLNEILSSYPPYAKIKNILSEKSADSVDLKKITGLTEVAIEIVLRLLSYVDSDLCCANERFYIKTKVLPETFEFLATVRQVCNEMRQDQQWGCGKEFIRVDKIACETCTRLRLSTDDFGRLFSDALEQSLIEMHSEVASFQFMPFSPKRVDVSSYRKCYMRIRGGN